MDWFEYYTREQMSVGHFRGLTIGQRKVVQGSRKDTVSKIITLLQRTYVSVHKNIAVDGQQLEITSGSKGPCAAS